MCMESQGSLPSDVTIGYLSNVYLIYVHGYFILHV